MKTIELIDPSSDYSRNLFLLIDHLPSFSLVECRLKDSIDCSQASSILFLDNIDQAVDPRGIIEKVSRNKVVQFLILVSKRKRKDLDLPENQSPSQSYSFTRNNDDPNSCGISSLCGTEHYPNIEDAAKVIMLTKERSVAA